MAEGWGFPGNARKAHYFDGIVSLCHRWMYSGSLEYLEQAVIESPIDCKECRRLLAKRKAD